MQARINWSAMKPWALTLLLLASCAGAEASLRKARTLHEQGDDPAAIEALNRYFQAGGRWTRESAVLFATALRNDESASGSVVARLEKQDLSPLESRLQAAGWFEEAGLTDAAYDLYVAAVRIDPKTLDALRGRARINYSRKEYKLASIDLGAVILFDGSDSTSCVMLARSLIYDDPPRFEQARDALKMAVERGADGADVYADLGGVHFELKAWPEAEQAFEESIDREESAEVLVMLGRSRITQGEHDEALKALDRASELDAKNGESRFMSGMIRYMTGRDTGRGFKEIIEGIDLGYRTAGSLVLRASCLRDAAQLELALNDLAEAIKLDPGYFQAYAIQAEIYFGMTRYKEAFEAADMALSIQPDIARTQSFRAHAAIQLDKYDEALKALNEAVRLSPDNLKYRMARGWLHFEMGRFEASRSDLELVGDRGGMYSIEWRGRARLKTGAVEQGLADLRKVLVVAPDRGDLWVIVGRAELGRENREAAAEAAGKALEANPEDLDALELQKQAQNAD